MTMYTYFERTEARIERNEDGVLVARYDSAGERMNTLKHFGEDLPEAERYAELWNGPTS